MTISLKLPVNRKTIAATFILAFLFSAVAGAQFVNLVVANFIPPIDHASGIFIRSNGNVDPLTAPIQRVGYVYTFTDDVSVGIAVQRSGVTIDGNNYELVGNNSGTGFYLQSVNDVTIQNVKVQNFNYGFYLDHSNNSMIKRNIVTGCSIAVTQRSCYNQVVGNTVVKGGIGLDFGNGNIALDNNVSGISIVFSTNITVRNNRIAGDKRADVNLLYAGEGGGIYIDNSDDCDLFRNVIERQTIGINIWHCTNLNFSGNILRDNQCGIKLWGAGLERNLHSIDATNTVEGKPIYFLVNQSDLQVPNSAGWIAAVNCRNITIQNWASTPNWDSILFVNTNNSKIAHSNLTHSFNAIRFDSASNCLISNNRINNNGYAAFYFEGAVNCRITDNDVADNFCFFNLWHSSLNNSFFHNNFVGNWTGSPGDRESQNFWDSGSEGNYWSTHNGTDSNENGISDSPYLIDSYSDSVDRYPLMKPFLIQEPRDGESIITPTAEPFQATLIMASVVSVTIVGTGLVIYFKKRNSSE